MRHTCDWHDLQKRPALRRDIAHWTYKSNVWLPRWTSSRLLHQMFAMEFVLWQTPPTDRSNVAIGTGGNMFNHQLKRTKTRNSWWQSSIRYFWKTWNIPGFDLAWQNHTRTPQERRTSADSVTSHKCVPLTGSLMDCVYVYTVVASRRVQALLRNLHWAEHEDKYTNPVDRKETVRHI